jgi:hypothetical protein
MRENSNFTCIHPVIYGKSILFPLEEQFFGTPSRSSSSDPHVLHGLFLAKDNCGKNMLMIQQDFNGGGGGGERGISGLKGLGVRNKNGLRDRERRNGFGKEKNRGRINGKLFRGKERRVMSFRK